MTIIGFDPSLRHTGYAVVKIAHPTPPTALDYGVLRVCSSLRPSQCLQKIYNLTLELIEKYQPMHAALEGIIYLQNAAVAITLGAARGVILLALESKAIPTYEYAPRRIKQAATGLGNSGKNQVANMMRSLFRLDHTPTHDIADALAIAWTHYQSILAPMSPTKAL
ncbi:MAG: crossover junction endodeoxyribonuclease RuvC [Methylacidiphilales bacterium]|nr:crossover junction endodeoxyribonuclease RuvC [Candidatus Methylacidiphilales bacterium]MDW8349977.1 crossover junction endodeoxyribonuclease RuvC [Verrucomicrobiae bacterium]